MTPSNQLLVPFKGDKLPMVEVAGQAYVACKPICDALGVSWSRQRKKLVANETRFCVALMAMQMPEDDQSREHMFIPIQRVFGWLMAIHPTKVADEATREKLTAYQQECDLVLWRYYHGQMIEPKRALSDNLINELLTRKPVRAKIKLFCDQHHHFERIAAFCTQPRWKVAAIVDELLQLGVIAKPPEGWSAALANPPRARSLDPETLDMFASLDDA